MMSSGARPSVQSGSLASITRRNRAGIETRPLASTLWVLSPLNTRATFAPASFLSLRTENGGLIRCHRSTRRPRPALRGIRLRAPPGGMSARSRAGTFFIDEAGCLYETCFENCLRGLCAPSSFRTHRETCIAREFTGDNAFLWELMVKCLQERSKAARSRAIIAKSTHILRSPWRQTADMRGPSRNRPIPSFPEKMAPRRVRPMKSRVAPDECRESLARRAGVAVSARRCGSERPPADIAAADALGPVDAVHEGVGALGRLAQAVPARGDREDAPAIGDELPAAAGGAGM